jgi:Uma2 family endonuclease
VLTAKETTVAQKVIAAPEERLRMSYDEYLAWWGEGTQGEWVDGEVTVFMPPRFTHQRLLLFLSHLPAMYARRLNLGEVIVAPFEMLIRSGRSSRQPDILFVARNHLDRLSEERLDGPADLVIELVSPDSVTRDRKEKMAEYEAEGVPEYWVLDARRGRRRANFYQLTPEGIYQEIPLDAAGRYHSAVLSEFWLDPEWLWQDPPPDPVALLAAITL